MRRLKRDPLERAFLRGYQHGINGKSRDLCPFTDTSTSTSARQAWINGWREGRGDNWDGLTGTAGIHRLNALNAVG
jgi:ribosome modulation factor